MAAHAQKDAGLEQKLAETLISLEDVIKIDDDKGNHIKQVPPGFLDPLLISRDQRKEIVLVGEGNFTLSIALAALRGSWDGITTTSYRPVDRNFCVPSISDLKLLSIEYAMKNGRELLLQKVEDSYIVDNIRNILDLPSPKDYAWRFCIDATNLPEDLPVEGKVVWFQCPWIPGKGPTGESLTYKLIKCFLEHMATKQSQHDYVLIGIANDKIYVGDYELQKLLGEEFSGPVVVKDYSFVGADETLIEKLLRHGYKHECYVPTFDIHKDIINCHVTLIFQHN